MVLAGHLVAGVARDALAELEPPHRAVIGFLPALGPAAGHLLLPFLVDAGAAGAVLRVPDGYVLHQIAAVGVVHDVLGLHRERDLVHGGGARRIGGNQGVVLVGRRRGHAVRLRVGGGGETKGKQRKGSGEAGSNNRAHRELSCGRGMPTLYSRHQAAGPPRTRNEQGGEADLERERTRPGLRAPIANAALRSDARSALIRGVVRCETIRLVPGAAAQLSLDGSAHRALRQGVHEAEPARDLAAPDEGAAVRDEGVRFAAGGEIGNRRSPRRPRAECDRAGGLSAWSPPPDLPRTAPEEDPSPAPLRASPAPSRGRWPGPRPPT